ncbi:MAG TPA: hypothetical protein VER12_06530 [Polyangiaceae bacterium]|nr:hypothetical protein [Polyangiaceae bacterium]
MAFDDIRLILNKVGGIYQAAPVTVRWHGTQSFTLDPSPPDSTDASSPQDQPFKLSASTPDPANPFAATIAVLTFVGKVNAEPADNWHSSFDGAATLTQAMNVKGVGLRPLTIFLSCTEHPKLVLNSLKEASYDAPPSP